MIKNGDGQFQLDSSCIVHLMGKRVNVQEQVRLLQSEAVWLTYKSDFRPLLIERAALISGDSLRKVQNLTTDCAWGCTIRAT
jgi:hypothetical protein